ncbi:hypothetical protein, partial [Corynebacterium pyruviciproducens]|uniref:hypothetical protein n=1 Tax=Corynebacterium pyruviciproducens TaxID=598660 RepID=UPI00254EE732
GVNNVMTLSVNNAMTSSVQKVVTHNTTYPETPYQQRGHNLPPTPNRQLGAKFSEKLTAPLTYAW